MPSKKELKGFSKDIRLAIKWAAAEYGYIGELKDELEKVEGEDDPKKA